MIFDTLGTFVLVAIQIWLCFVAFIIIRNVIIVIEMF